MTARTPGVRCYSPDRKRDRLLGRTNTVKAHCFRVGQQGGDRHLLLIKVMRRKTAYFQRLYKRCFTIRFAGDN